jgi:hypothetical protein
MIGSCITNPSKRRSKIRQAFTCKVSGHALSGVLSEQQCSLSDGRIRSASQMRDLAIDPPDRPRYPPEKYSPRKNRPHDNLHTKPLTNRTRVSPLLYRLSIDRPNAITGHNLLAHVITFRLSHWGTLSEPYLRCSSCIGARTSGWKAMRHS